MKTRIILLFLFVMLLVSVNYAQEKQHETSSAVPELEKFHEVIYSIWHTAWPEKDVKMLKSLLPDVEKGYNEIVKAKLPGILRDKQAKWDEGIKNLTASFNAYKTAAGKDEKQPLLDAAEKLHANYEGLVRAIRPVLKEVDSFHQELYSLYHYYSAEYNFEKIKASSVVLTAKMPELKKAQLSERLKTKKAAFDKAVAELDKAVENLAVVVKAGNNKDKVRAAVETVHTKYQAVEKVFE
jgi:hypothetical protein